METDSEKGRLVSSILLWLAVLCTGCAWTCWSGVYVSTYTLKTYEPAFGYGLAAASVALFILCLRRIRLSLSPKYLWTLVPLMVYALLIPYPYSLGPWVLVLGLVVTSCGKRSPLVRSVAPGILFSGLLFTLESLLVPLWYYLGCHDRGLPWLASFLARTFTFLGTTSSASAYSLYAQVMGDYRTIRVTADAIGLLPGLFILLGICLSLCLVGKGLSAKGWLKTGALWLGYLLGRYVVLLWIFLGWPTQTSIAMMWDPVACLLSFVPLAFVLALWGESLDLAGAAALTWQGLPRRPLAWTMVMSLAILAAVWGTSLSDPGRKKPGRVLIDEGHSRWEDTTRPFNTHWYGQASTYNYYCLRKFLEYYYDVTVNTEEISPEVLAEQDVVILKCPTQDYEREELDSLVAFVRKGGGLFLIGDHTDVFGTSRILNAVAGRFGLSFKKNGQWDIHGQFSVYKQPTTLGHPVGKHTPTFLFATGCTLSARLWYEKPIIGYGMMTRRADYKNKNFFPDEAHYEDREFGLFLQSAGAFVGRGRVLCFSDSTVWSNFSIFLQGKSELLLDSLMWLNRSNTWWAYVKPYVLLASLILMIAAALLSPPLHVLKKQHGVILSCFLAVIALSCYAVDAMHEGAYKTPKALHPYKKVTFDCEHSHIFLANRRWFPKEENKAAHYGAFFVATQRLGWVPQVRHSFMKALREERDPMVIVNPHKGFSEAEASRFHDYIAQGGNALILDASNRGPDSTAWQLLEPLSVQILYSRAEPSGENDVQEDTTFVFSEDKDYGRSVFFATQDICEIRGGKPRLWYDRRDRANREDRADWKPCLSEVSLGKGKIWVCTLSRAFSGAGLGHTSSIPNRYQQNIYRLVYKILHDLVSE